MGLITLEEFFSKENGTSCLFRHAHTAQLCSLLPESYWANTVEQNSSPNGTYSLAEEKVIDQTLTFKATERTPV